MPLPDKNALVLSAGGLYCAWQAGAWMAIRQSDPPDLVAGASAGALNGWPIAGGISPDNLIERWLDPGWSNLLQLKPGYGLRNGFFDPEPLRIQTEKIVSEFQPLIPFGLTLVELRRFRTVLFQYPEVTARHLLATCAIPVVMPPVSIGGVRYVDGGVIEKVPVMPALEMGATRMIVLDCMPVLNLWWLQMATEAIRSVRRKRPVPAGTLMTVIVPSEPLGDANAAVFWKKENLERWIELGYRDARRGLRESRPIGLAG